MKFGKMSLRYLFIYFVNYFELLMIFVLMKGNILISFDLQTKMEKDKENK